MASERQIRVGSVPIGGGAPVVVQSMTLTKTHDVEATTANADAVRDAALVVVAVSVLACKPKTDVEMWVDGFQPKNVRFEIEDKGPMSKPDIDELAKRFEDHNY